MAKCLDIVSWQASTPAEIREFLDPDRHGAKGETLVVRTYLKPVDVYSYLVARFGQPNGVQNLLRSDSSDNWIHWDFNIKSGDQHIHLAGTSREIHIITSEKLSDEEWKSLILAIKADYARVSKAKSAVFQKFEKFAVFQNKFVSIANLCADLHAEILDAPPPLPVPRIVEDKEDILKVETAFRQIGERGNKLFGDSLKLQLLTPVMAEAFINMIILTFCKDEIRNDREEYDRFVRDTIPSRLDLLSINCHGFERPIDKSTQIYGEFMRVVARRNFALHGNVDPDRETIEFVYFDGRRPLFTKPGHHLEKLFEQLELLHRPRDTVADYENVHLFLLEIMDSLSRKHRAFFEQVIEDGYPAYEVKKKRVTRILPDQVMMCMLPGLRYDDQLNVEWW
jgi:hypothetical protein